MIIKSVPVTKDGVTYNTLTSKNDFFALGYDDELLVVLVTVYDAKKERNGAIKGGSKINSLLNGFGSASYDDLIKEANKRGLKFP